MCLSCGGSCSVLFGDGRGRTKGCGERPFAWYDFVNNYSSAYVVTPASFGVNTKKALAVFAGALPFYSGVTIFPSENSTDRILCVTVKSLSEESYKRLKNPSSSG